MKSPTSGWLTRPEAIRADDPSEIGAYDYAYPGGVAGADLDRVELKTGVDP